MKLDKRNDKHVKAAIKAALKVAKEFDVEYELLYYAIKEAGKHPKLSLTKIMSLVFVKLEKLKV